MHATKSLLDPIDPAYRSYCSTSSSTYSCSLFGERKCRRYNAHEYEPVDRRPVFDGHTLTFPPNTPLSATSICQLCKCKFVPNGTSL